MAQTHPGGARRARCARPSRRPAKPLFLTSGYAYEAAEEAEARFKGESRGYQYSRFGNPTVSMFEERMAAAGRRPGGARHRHRHGGGHGRVPGALKTGDHVVAAKAMFGSCRMWWRRSCRASASPTPWWMASDLGAWEAAMRPETSMLFLETPSNPTLVDRRHRRRWRRSPTSHGARLVVDNAFASPALQRPMEFGAHIVVHSSTKYIDGQGRALGGVILCDQDFLDEHLQSFLRNTGPSISPFNAWLHLKSLETLDLRMKRALRECRASRRFPGRPEAR